MKKKRVLITGADGFLGSFVTEAVQKKYEVRAMCLYNPLYSTGNLAYASISSSTDIIFSDVRDMTLLENHMKGCDAVIHLAAHITIPFSYDAPYSYLETNTSGTLNVLKCARKLSVEHVIIVSTSEVYGSARYLPMDEEHPLSPQSPYAASKVAQDAFAYSFYRSFGLPVTIIRPFNAYGPRQTPRAVIPAIIIQALKGSSVHLGNTESMRDFNFAEDTASAFADTLFNKCTIGETINIGSMEMFSIKEIVDIVSAVSGKKLRIIQDKQRTRPAGSEVDSLMCDNSKARELIGYKPHYDIGRGIAETYKWFSRNAFYDSKKYYI